MTVPGEHGPEPRMERGSYESSELANLRVLIFTAPIGYVKISHKVK